MIDRTWTRQPLPFQTRRSLAQKLTFRRGRGISSRLPAIAACQRSNCRRATGTPGGACAECLRIAPCFRLLRTPTVRVARGASFHRRGCFFANSRLQRELRRPAYATSIAMPVFLVRATGAKNELSHFSSQAGQCQGRLLPWAHRSCDAWGVGRRDCNCLPAAATPVRRRTGLRCFVFVSIMAAGPP